MSDPFLPLHTTAPGVSYSPDNTAGVAGGSPATTTSAPTSGGGAPVVSPSSQYAGSVQANPYSSAASGPGGDGAFAQVQAAAQQAGFPYVSDQNLRAANSATQGLPARNTVTQALLNPATSPAAQATQAQQVTAAFDASVNSGIDPMTLAMLALMDGQNQKDKDLSMAQNRLSMYQVMSKKMADYSSYLQGVQRSLDGKTTAEKKDSKKSSVEVLVNQQLDFNTDSMISLDKNGAYNVKNLAEGQSDKTNMVNAGSLTTRLQLFGQQRDLLQKNIDKWTTTYQNDLQQKNNLAQTVSQMIKDRRDTNMGTIHNI